MYIFIIGHLLTEEERGRRFSFRYRRPFVVIGASPTSILVNTNIPSFFWLFYQELYVDMCEHLHVDMAIVDYNYARLKKCVDLWTKERTGRFQQKQHEVALDQTDYAIALEFYLQIDGKRDFLIDLKLSLCTVFACLLAHHHHHFLSFSSKLVLHENMLISWCSAR